MSDESDISMECLSDDYSNSVDLEPIERKAPTRVRKEVKYINDDSINDDETKMKSYKKREDSDYDNDLGCDDSIDDEFKNKNKISKATITDSKHQKEKSKVTKRVEEKDESSKDGQGLLRIKKNNSKTTLKRHNIIESDQDSENKPPHKTSKKNEASNLKLKETSNNNIIDFFKPKEKSLTNTKKSKCVIDDVSIIDDDSSDEDFEIKSKSKPKSKKLLAVNNYNDKSAKNIIKNKFEDDDLFEID